jgi:Secretion system C-terminal sorting domain
MKLNLFSLCCFFISSIVLCFDDPPDFGPRQNKGKVENDDIDEASGLVASYKNPGILWTHNDSGGENRIFAIDTNGVNRGIYFLNGAENRDWEDITIGPGPVDGLSYLYVGDIGDNDAQYSKKYIYRIIEPTVSTSQDDTTENVQDVSVITFSYPDGKRDAETLMIDPITKDLYIVGKRDSKIRLYKLSYPYSTTSDVQAEISAELTLPNDPEVDEPFNYVTAGDISFDGTEILLKSYRNIYYWCRNSQNSISEILTSTTPQILPYNNSIDESQCEAICWNPFDDRGYYTLSEESFSVEGSVLTFPAQLYYYPRSITVGVKEESLNNKFQLNQNFPNPFNPSTSINYILPNENFVELKVYDNLGGELVTLVNKNQSAGDYEVNFNAGDYSNGIYYYSLRFGNFTKTKKMVLLK